MIIYTVLGILEALLKGTFTTPDSSFAIGFLIGQFIGFGVLLLFAYLLWKEKYWVIFILYVILAVRVIVPIFFNHEILNDPTSLFAILSYFSIACLVTAILCITKANAQKKAASK